MNTKTTEDYLHTIVNKLNKLVNVNEFALDIHFRCGSQRYPSVRVPINSPIPQIGDYVYGRPVVRVNYIYPDQYSEDQGQPPSITIVLGNGE